MKGINSLWTKTHSDSSEIRLGAFNSNDYPAHYISLNSPSLTSTLSWNLPSSQGSAGNLLKNNDGTNWAWTQKISNDNLPDLTWGGLWKGDSGNRPSETFNYVQGPIIPGILENIVV